MDTKNSLPKYVRKYFWGDNLKQLNWDKHQQYIIKTILEKGDRKSVKWIFSHLTKQRLKKSLPKFKLSLKSKNFWNLYLS